VNAKARSLSPVGALLDAVAAALGPERVLTAPEQLACYSGFQWLPPRRHPLLRVPLGQPAGVVRPRNAEDVALVLRRATAAGVLVVPFGAASGVMGAALTLADSIALDLGALNRIWSIEPQNQLARVEAGVVLGDLAQAAQTQGLLFAHDPWSQPIATVGGAIGTNGVGYLAAGYGAMGQQIRGVEAVLPTGERVDWPGAAKTSTGPELWRLFTGAEGTLGVVTSAVVQLYPWPEARSLTACRFPTFADGFRAIRAFADIGLRPAMVDYEEEDESRLPLTGPAELHLAFDGPAEVVRAATRRASQVCREHGGRNQGQAAAEEFWAERHASIEWFLRREANRVADPPERDDHPREEMRYVDVAVPTARVLDYCAQVVEIARSNGAAVHSFGIWARSELVSYILEGESAPAGHAEGPLDRTLDQALLLARREGGSIEYCHGVGLRLAHLLPSELGSAYDLLRRVKSTLDPAGIMNPGKLGL